MCKETQQNFQTYLKKGIVNWYFTEGCQKLFQRFECCKWREWDLLNYLCIRACCPAWKDDSRVVCRENWWKAVWPVQKSLKKGDTILVVHVCCPFQANPDWVLIITTFHLNNEKLMLYTLEFLVPYQGLHMCITRRGIGVNEVAEIVYGDREAR